MFHKKNLEGDEVEQEKTGNALRVRNSRQEKQFAPKVGEMCLVDNFL